ncbi:hypothetical protein M2302_002228 [Micromonospora sp. A200]|uniref:phage tail domain-containing protein n=1 Tax=Micromonospora sp. A200 TaxID=2940568 RepID=UPI002475F5A8|nr:phage tail domain-containing protein [Micromonospora sp. A200]MDH6462053.1 hypothetical protein [Micromonospora sp. A200]
MPRLQLETATDVLNLDDILNKGVGVQALRGTVGLGLPEVSVQWLEGAGDGAMFRGQRVLPRDIDLPLHIKANSRAEMKALLNKLSRMLAGECTLRLVEDDGSDWSVRVRRVGGGNYSYGLDTIGEKDFSTVITFRAGDPFWIYSRTSSTKVENSGSGRSLLKGLATMQVSASQAIGKMLLDNTGSAPAYPVWLVHGPGSGLEVVSNTGQGFKWNGTLGANDILTIDTKAGTVVDQAGANRYADLAAAPRFWPIPPGRTSVTASLLNTSAGTIVAKGGVLWKNLVTNPRFESAPTTTPIRTNLMPNPVLANDASNWGAVGASSAARSTEQNRYGGTVASYKTVATGGVTFGGYANSLAGSVVAGDPVYGSMYVYSSAALDFKINVEFKDSANVKLSTVSGSVVSVPANTWTRVGGYGGLAPANTSYVTVACYTTGTLPAAGDVAYFDAALIEKSTSMENFFEGSWSASGIYTHRWTGTAHASTSEMLAPLATGQEGSAGLDITPLLRDTFTRSVTGGVGTSDSGATYTTGGGTTANYWVDGSRLNVKATTPGITYEVIPSAPTALADFDITMLIHTPDLVADPSNPRINIQARRVDGNNFVEARVWFTDANITTSLLNRSGGVDTSTTAYPGIAGSTTNSPVRVRFQGTGNKLRLRGWLDGTAEPTTWAHEWTCSHTAAGPARFATVFPAAYAKGVPATWQFDDLTVTNPTIREGAAQDWFHCWADGSAGSRYGRWRVLPGTPAPKWRVARSKALSRTEIVAGQKYTLLMRMRVQGWGSPGITVALANPGYGNRVMDAVTVSSVGSAWKDVRVVFTAQADASVDSTIGLYCGLPLNPPAAGSGHGTFDIAYWAVVPGDYTGTYFDGDNKDTEIAGYYDWTGTPHASVSTNSLAEVQGRSSITCTWRPRNWMVI